MTKLPLIALEIAIGFLVPLGWAVWELVSLRREQRKDAQKAAAARRDASVGTGDCTAQPTTNKSVV